MYNSSAAHAGDPMEVTTTTRSPAISNLGIAEVEDGDNGMDLEIRIIYGIVGIALVALLILFVMYIVTRLLKKSAPRRSSRSDTVSIDSWVMVCDHVPEVHLQEKAGTSFSRDDVLVSIPPSQTTSEGTAEPLVAEPGLSSFERRTLSLTITPAFTLMLEDTVNRTPPNAAVDEVGGVV